MGMTLSVAFKKKVPGHGTLGSDHVDLGDNVGRLDKLLKKAKLTELQTFHSADPAEFVELFDLDEDDPSLEPEQWFEAADGLAAVRGAIGYVEANATALRGVRDEVLEDLRDVEQELLLAETKRVKFHFALLD